MWSGCGQDEGLARSCVWWPGLDQDLEDCAKDCTACQEGKNAPPKAHLHPLITTNAHSKWPEVCVMTQTTSNKTISALRELFARFGIHEQLVSENGPQFVSDEFESFLSRNGVKHIRSSPATNGAAERLVQTVQQVIRAGRHRGVPLEQALAAFLLRYRSTPHATTGVAPRTQFMGRELRTRLHLLKPEIGVRVGAQQVRQKKYHERHSQAREFSVDQVMWARKMGTVVDRLGPLTYMCLVQTERGDLWRRHVDHLRGYRI